MVCDETNLDETERVRFFVYGGLIVPAEAIGELTERVGEIRQEHGFRPGDSLKFRTSSRPRTMSKASWTAAKTEVIEATEASGATLVACLVLHAIARRRRDKLVEWQLNTVLATFSNLLLEEVDDVGWVVRYWLPRRTRRPRP
jgi:hypothetical protein